MKKDDCRGLGLLSPGSQWGSWSVLMFPTLVAGIFTNVVYFFVKKFFLLFSKCEKTLIIFHLTLPVNLANS